MTPVTIEPLAKYNRHSAPAFYVISAIAALHIVKHVAQPIAQGIHPLVD